MGCIRLGIIYRQDYHMELGLSDPLVAGYTDGLVTRGA
jgi:hypothetical protein